MEQLFKNWSECLKSIQQLKASVPNSYVFNPNGGLNISENEGEILELPLSGGYKSGMLPDKNGSFMLTPKVGVLYDNREVYIWAGEDFQPSETIKVVVSTYINKRGETRKSLSLAPQGLTPKKEVKNNRSKDIAKATK